MSAYDQLVAWRNGTATGGPNGDGRYPLTGSDGQTYLVLCPAAQALNPEQDPSEVETFTNTATAAAAGALDSQIAAAASAAAAEDAAEDAADSADSAQASSVISDTKAGLASGFASNAELYKNTAVTASNAAAGSATDAAASNLLASQWASNPEDALVVTGKYSALHWAAKAAASAASAAANAVNLTWAYLLGLSGKPTTLSGWGITDGAGKAAANTFTLANVFNQTTDFKNGLRHTTANGVVLDNIAIKSYTSVPNGYIKLVTPIQTAHNQMFAIDVVGYDYNLGKPLDFTVVGYAYGATDNIIKFGLSNRSAFSVDVRLALEDRGTGTRVLVIALGAETAAGTSNQAWYYQKFSATVKGWGGQSGTWTADQFTWVTGETTLAAGFFETANLNNLWMDAQLGTVNASGAMTAGSFVGPLTGNASSASTATKLTTSRTFALGGLLGGSATFNGTGNCTITATMADGALSIAKISGLQAALDAKQLAGSSVFVTGTNKWLINNAATSGKDVGLFTTAAGALTIVADGFNKSVTLDTDGFKYGGYGIWHAGNFDPDTKAPKNNPSFTGTAVFATTAGKAIATSGGTFNHYWGGDNNATTLLANTYYNAGWQQDDPTKPSFAFMQHLGNSNWQWRFTPPGGAQATVATLDGSGVFTANAVLSNNNVVANTNFLSSNTYWVAAPNGPGSLIFRPGGVTDGANQAVMDSSANFSTTGDLYAKGVRVPKTFVQSGDPGGSAVTGDLWIW